MKKKLFMGFLFALPLLSFSQSDSSTKTEAIQFRVGSFYNSALHYYGRTDSLKSSGFFPLAEIWIKERFYVNAAPVFIHNSALPAEYAGTVATAGYQAFSKNRKWLTHVFFTKPFYTSASELPQSVLKFQPGVQVSWQNKIANLNMGSDLRFSDKMDIGLQAGIDHIFRKQVGNAMILAIDPSIYVFAGTQEFTRSYTKRTTGFLGFPTGEEEVSEQVSRLDILSVDFSLPLILVRKKMQVIVNPSLVLPQHVLDPANGEEKKGEQVLGVTAGVKFIL